MRTKRTMWVFFVCAAAVACSDDTSGGAPALVDRDVDAVRPVRDVGPTDTDALADAPRSDATDDPEDRLDAEDLTDDVLDDADGASDDGASNDVSTPDGLEEDAIVDADPLDADPDVDAADTDDAIEPDTDVEEEEELPEPDGMLYHDFLCEQRWADSPIRITEVMIDPNNAEGQDSATEWFEIENIGAVRYELRGVEVRDDGSDSFVIFGDDRLEYEGFYQDPFRTFIDPGQILPFYQKVEGDVDCRDGTNPDCKLYVGEHFYVFRRDGGMALGNGADELILKDTEGRVLDCIRWTRALVDEGVSWQRMRGEEGTYTDTWCLTAPVERRRYNDNAEPPLLGDHGTPGGRTRCW